jgi:NitT/TauT family transport system permease protein
MESSSMNKPGLPGWLQKPPAALVLTCLLLLWQAATWLFEPSAFILPDPISIGRALIDNPNTYLVNAYYTAANTLIGFGLSVVIGFALALGIVYSRFLEATIYTTLVAVNSMPKVALAPLFVVWMGTGNTSKVAMAFLIAIFAIVIEAVLGLRSLDTEIVDLGRSMRGSPFKLLWKIRLPNALPSLFAGMKVAIGLSLVGVLVGEFVSAQHGLGYVIMAAQGAFDTPRVFVAILLLSVMGTMLFRAIEIIERRVIPWHVSQRGAAH